jgi:hypothetical protein
MSLQKSRVNRVRRVWVDEHGRPALPAARGYPRIELPVNSDPSSAEFQAAYHAALRGEATQQAFATTYGSASLRQRWVRSGLS